MDFLNIFDQLTTNTKCHWKLNIYSSINSDGSKSIFRVYSEWIKKNINLFNLLSVTKKINSLHPFLTNEYIKIYILLFIGVLVLRQLDDVIGRFLNTRSQTF